MNSPRVVVPTSTQIALAGAIKHGGLDYSLRMLWLGRFDKLSYGEKEHLIWLTQKFVPGAGSYAAVPGTVAFVGQDHYELALAAVTAYKAAVDQK